MDLNPLKFQAPWTDYEFASHALASGAEILILSMVSKFRSLIYLFPMLTPKSTQAWLRSPSNIAVAGKDEEPDLDALGYWIQRLCPLVIADQEVLVVCANRCGEEPGNNPVVTDGTNGVEYAGTSWVGIVGRQQVRLWGILGRREEGVLVVDTTKEPKWTWSSRATGNAINV